MAVKTTEIDRGYKALIKQIESLKKKPYVSVGYPESKNEKHDNSSGSFTVAEIATVHEFGSDVNNIPARPTLTATADKQRKKVNKIFEEGINEIATGKKTPVDILKKVGAFLQGRTQKAIKDLTSPALNKPRKDGSSNPLVDSGQMRQSVAFEVKESSK